MTQSQKLAAAAAVFTSAYARRTAAFLAHLEAYRVEGSQVVNLDALYGDGEAETGFSWLVRDEIQALARHPGRPSPGLDTP